MDTETAWQKLTDRVRELKDLAGIDGMLEWDQHVWMPPAGGAYRGRHKALISRLQHEGLVDPALGEWLAVVAGDPATAADPVRAAAVRNLGRQRDRACKLPASLVQAQAQATSDGFAAWVQARGSEDLAAFAGPLGHIVDLARQEAACLGPVAHPYDALVGRHDPGMDMVALQALFTPLSAALVDLLDRIRGAAPLAPHPVAVPVDAQRRIHARVAAALGFDMSRGRLDEAHHPFTMGIGPQDVRLTTRYFAGDLLAGLLGTVHEAGHGMYEQGMPEALAGSTVDDAASTGMHESQSRFWENVIGRSRPFLAWLQGVVREESGVDYDLDAVYASANRVAPSFIRVEADEVTYNLHIALRTRLEAALLGGDLSVAALPGAWDDLSQELLGLRPERPSQGVLQDVHWGAGLIGYFPSYTLGNIYAAALTERLSQDLPDLGDRVGRGDFAPVLGWLREKVHQRGHRIDGAALVAELAPGRDPVAAFVAHVEARHGRLYGVAKG